MIVGQGPAALAVGAGVGGAVLTLFLSVLSPSLEDDPINTEILCQRAPQSKIINQSTNQICTIILN